MSALCDFCNQDHDDGVPEAMSDAGHPYYASHSRSGGFGYTINGRYETLTSAEVEERKNNGWRRLGPWTGPEPIIEYMQE